MIYSENGEKNRKLTSVEKSYVKNGLQLAYLSINSIYITEKSVCALRKKINGKENCWVLIFSVFSTI